MSEHLIRLRGGWEFHMGESVRRLALPLTWPPGLVSRVRLVRPFNRPPIDLQSERLGLRLDDVRGLLAVRLNGRELARPAPGTSMLELPLDEPLPARNVLELDVAPETTVEPAAWGRIALVIRPRGG